MGRLVAGVPAVLAALAVVGCGAAVGPRSSAHLPRTLVAQARPIGRGARFRPPVRGPVIGRCRRTLGRRVGVHVEVFARNRVVLVGTGIGTRPPRRTVTGRIVAARCYGEVVTLDPTGLVLVRPGVRLELGDVFRSWGQPLSGVKLAGFHAPPGTRTRVFVDGRRWRAALGGVPLRRHAEIVLEVAPFVPPHPAYRFPAGT